MTLYLFKVLNYYNRIVKRADNISDYTTRLGGSQLQMVEGVSFNPNDGISTKHIINYTAESMPDYLVVVDERNNINSRWYIIEAKRVRASQYEFTLYRDVIADWYEDIIQAPAFIEKATLSATDPLIFNKEQMTYNQIKKSEIPLYDITNTPWIVGYLNRNIPAENRTIVVPAEDVITSGEYSSLEDFPYGERIKEFPEYPTFRINIEQDKLFDKPTYSIGWNKNNQLVTPKYNAESTGVTGLAKTKPEADSRIMYQDDKTLTDICNEFGNVIAQDEPNLEYSDYLTTANEVLTDAYKNAVGNIYKIGDKYYEFSIKKHKYGYRSDAINITSGLGENIKTLLDKVVTDYSVRQITPFQIEYPHVEYEPILTEINIKTINFTLNESHPQTSDAPYDIIAMPYLEWKPYIPALSNKISNPAATLRIASQLQRKLTSAYMYDIQLLPYCPLTDDVFTSDGNLKVDTNTNRLVLGSQYYQEISDSDNNYVTTIFFAPSSKFSKSINKDTYKIIAPNSAIDVKIQSECDVYRLCSPNYNGQFEFSAVKNNGVSSWDIDCTYKPYQPYIHVAPNFNGLYGSDFNDARGLVCGGDFSLPQISDKWQEYQINNKNFSNIFERQIENMEVQHKYQRTEDIVNAITGTIAGAGAGAMAGTMVSPGIGTVIGAIGGGIASGIGGVMDIGIKEALRNEALDYTKDQFGYQLGNIRALPYTLTKISALTANNKLVPFLEYYTATDVEKNALRNKIKYNGMTVMTVGLIADYLREDLTYIKGKIIRIESISDDYHILTAIAEEFNKGVFI